MTTPPKHRTLETDLGKQKCHYQWPSIISECWTFVNVFYYNCSCIYNIIHQRKASHLSGSGLSTLACSQMIGSTPVDTSTLAAISTYATVKF